MVALQVPMFLGYHAGKNGCGGDVYREESIYPSRFDPVGRLTSRNVCYGCGAAVGGAEIITQEEADDTVPVTVPAVHINGGECAQLEG